MQLDRFWCTDWDRRKGERIYKGFIGTVSIPNSYPMLGTMLVIHIRYQRSTFIWHHRAQQQVDSHTTTAHWTLRDYISCSLLLILFQVHVVYYLCTAHWHRDIWSSKHCFQLPSQLFLHVTHRTTQHTVFPPLSILYLFHSNLFNRFI